LAYSYFDIKVQKKSILKNRCILEIKNVSNYYLSCFNQF